jgi:hypothetical protein
MKRTEDSNNIITTIIIHMYQQSPTNTAWAFHATCSRVQEIVFEDNRSKEIRQVM